MSLLFPVFVAVLAVMGLSVVSDAGAEGDSVDLKIRSERLSGSELRVIVETSRQWTPPVSHRSKTADAKGYLVLVDLDSQKPFADRAKLVGPIWEVPNARSNISFQVGANFTEDDAKAAAATPTCVFDKDGKLLRLARDEARKVVVRDSLLLSPGSGSWKREGDMKPVLNVPEPLSEDRVLTESEQYILFYHEGKAECFNWITGEQKNDPWLTGAFAEVRSIKNFENVRLFLTEDLNHLVVRPHAIWNDFPNKIYETFDFDGKTHRRADVGLVYSRPTQKPLLFPRKLDEHDGFLDQPPHAAFSIAGELYLFENGKTKLRLYTPSGEKEIVAKVPDGLSWFGSAYPRIQHSESTHEIVMFESKNIYEEEQTKEGLSVLRWNYVSNTIRHDDLSISDLFELRGGQFHPKIAISIK